MSDIKISVVVAAYRPGAGFRRVVDSLAAQTLPQEEFEVIVIDDGSPDDTFAMLQEVREERPNYRIERIENSGWPSRPRNIGIEMAVGEYVLFMDHDDSIFPDGLRAAYDFAKANDADVVSAKELKTSDPRFGLGNFTGDVANARPKGVGCLLPMMPHKFYRRQMLIDHDIRFPEGRKVLWEDVFFNVAAYRYSKVISILSSAPVYLWHQTGTNNSSTYGPWEEHFWNSLERLYAFIDQTLDGPEFETARRSQFLHHYRIRTIGRISDMLLKGQHSAGEERFAVERGQHILETYVPREWDRHLNHMHRVYGHLIREGEVDALKALVRFDAQFEAHPTLADARWSPSAIEIDTEARWTSADGTPLPFATQDGRTFRLYPDDVAPHVPRELAALTTGDLTPVSVPSVRNIAASSSWRVPAKAQLVLEPVKGGTPGRLTPVLKATGTIEPASLAAGRAIGVGAWQLRARNEIAGLRGDGPVGDAPMLWVAADGTVSEHADRAPTVTSGSYLTCDLLIPLSFLRHADADMGEISGTARLRVKSRGNVVVRAVTGALQRFLDRNPGRVVVTEDEPGAREIAVQVRAVRRTSANLDVDIPGVGHGVLSVQVPADRGAPPVVKVRSWAAHAH